MFEIMIEEIKPFLPLKISTMSWANSQLQISGIGWSFTSSGSWRITEKEKMLLGCFDNDSSIHALQLKDKIIIDVGYQDTNLKLDPIFIFSDNQVLEIFSMNTINPWTFRLEQLGIFVGTPNEPNTFIKS